MYSVHCVTVRSVPGTLAPEVDHKKLLSALTLVRTLTAVSDAQTVDGRVDDG